MDQNRLLTAFFDSMADAQRAVDKLVQIGISRDRIEMTAGVDAGSRATAESSNNYEQMGFWASLKSMFMPDEDRYAYAEGLRRGGYLVSLHPTEAQHDQAVRILEDEGTVDMDEREQTWRDEGWSGYQQRSGDMATTSGLGDSAGAMGGVTPAGTTAAGMGDVAGFTGMGATTGMGAPDSLGTGVGAAADSSRSATGAVERGASLRTKAEGVGAASPGAESDAARAVNAGGVTKGAASLADDVQLGVRHSDIPRAGREGDEVIPVVEEQLRVGKRETGGGRVRVRSYVVETPVEEQVELRDERVSVDRRPVDRPLSGTADPFKERTIEASERKEMPVVTKEARVTEEVALRKDAETRRETVGDTVRSTKVEVDDQRERNAASDPARQ